ncbi:MAG: hypothetical protein CME36_09260 [unclassified Hahellaceae]|nr:hypothetical protein [Hahellaceae bacterium]|tara:strand:- start:47506 stop:48435 length:930 start_codon:yes stop_codon:yes gene_type:complete
MKQQNRKLSTARDHASERILSRPLFWVSTTGSIGAFVVALTILVDAVPTGDHTVALPVVDSAEAVTTMVAPVAEPDTLQMKAPVQPAPQRLEGTVAQTTNDAPTDFESEHLADESGNYGFTVTPAQESQYQSLNTNSDYPSLETRMLEMQARRGGKVFDPESVLKALAQEHPWQESAEASDQLDLTPEQRFDGREFVKVDQMKIETLVPGDTLELPVSFESGSMEMVVDNVEVSETGEVTWFGRIKDYEQENQVSITQGETVTIGGITTPNGEYMIESRAAAGWIVPTGTLFNPGDEDDRVYPPEQKNS